MRAWSRTLYFRRMSRAGVFFVLPALLFFVLFNTYPMVYAFFVSLLDYDLITKPKFVGFKNYLFLLTDPVFWRSMQATAVYVLGTNIPIWFVSLGIALLLNRHFRGRGLFRTLYFIPAIMSLVVISIIWKFMYHPYGLINTLLSYIGLKKPYTWLTSTTLAPVAMIILSIWKGAPYYAVIYLSGLETIPREYYEAGMIDGVNVFQRFRHITWPLLKPTTLFIVVISVLIGLRVFIPQKVLTGGGPAGVTRVVTLAVYETAFKFYRMSLATTMSLILFVFIALLSAFQFRMFSDRRRGQA
jgi:multiple sugar transport system permease protein